MKDVLLDRVGDTTNGMYRHAEVHDNGSVHVYEHFYRDGVTDSKLVILYPEDAEKILPVVEEVRKVALRA